MVEVEVLAVSICNVPEGELFKDWVNRHDAAAWRHSRISICFKSSYLIQVTKENIYENDEGGTHPCLWRPRRA
jgi:hypothetical protein